MISKWFPDCPPFHKALPSRACCKNCTLPVIFTTSVFTGRPLGRAFPQKSCEKVRFAGGIFAFFFNFSRILTHKLQQYPKFPQQIDILYAFLWGIARSARSAMPGSAHPKRSRYYSAVLDVKNLKRGDKYNSLRPSYIIFICQFDYFNQGEAVYVLSLIHI